MRTILVCVTAIFLSACAGRDATPVATSQLQDNHATCAQIQAEIQTNNARVRELADEQGLKVVQNVAAGVGGLFIWPLWFAMDFKGAASQEVTALQARQHYLAILATERCASRPARLSPRSAARQPGTRPPAAESGSPSAYYQPPLPQRDIGTPN